MNKFLKYGIAENHALGTHMGIGWCWILVWNIYREITHSVSPHLYNWEYNTYLLLGWIGLGMIAHEINERIQRTGRIDLGWTKEKFNYDSYTDTGGAYVAGLLALIPIAGWILPGFLIVFIWKYQNVLINRLVKEKQGGA